MNEKLLGDFIKKHNVRDKLFSEFDAKYQTIETVRTDNERS